MSRKLPTRIPVAERILRRISITDSGCWEWQGVRNRDGYGVIEIRQPGTGRRGGGRAQRAAHRISYETFAGPIPEGLTIDHLCRNRACVNPEHLEPVTQRVNTLRGEGLPAQLARQTHCKRGHALSGANLLWQSAKGRRYRKCRECLRLRNKARGTGLTADDLMRMEAS